MKEFILKNCKTVSDGNSKGFEVPCEGIFGLQLIDGCSLQFYPYNSSFNIAASNFGESWNQIQSVSLFERKF